MLPYHYFLPYQLSWILDQSPLKIMEKSRQVGVSYADAFDSVLKASKRRARQDVWVSSLDEVQARLYLEDCQHWARLLHVAAEYLGQIVYGGDEQFTAHVLEFSSGRRIYSVSSNPNALAGKRGHVKLDEFALHHDQALLYRVAKPVTTWGGTLSIISTHRGPNTLFNQIISRIKSSSASASSSSSFSSSDPLTPLNSSSFADSWSLHSVPLHQAVAQGIVERINQKSGRNESREAFLARTQAECIDEEQWQQEYCCIPADETSAFITYDMLEACTERELRLVGFEELAGRVGQVGQVGPVGQAVFYLGVDVARKRDLCVLDVGEKIGDVVWDRMRIELSNKTFAEIRFELYRLLRMTQVKRCCIDASGMGMQLAEEAKREFAWKVEPITFTAAVKEELAFGLRRDFEERRLRIPPDERLRSDLRGIKKEVTLSGNIRFAGESEDSHCDRFWAKALRQQAARIRREVGAFVG